MYLKVIDWNELQAISTTILVLTSAGAIGYAALQLRQEREYRSVSNLEKQLTVFHGEAFRAARKRLAVDRLVNEELAELDRDVPPVSALEVLDFYDHIGLLVKKGHLEVYDVWHTFYEWAQPVYVDMRPLIEDEDSAFIDHYTDLRRLMRQMDELQISRMHGKNANHWALWTPDRIIDHYKYEIESGGRIARRTRKKAPEQNLIVSSS
ncbi:hypothetical protein [Granulicella sibirica]|uniref:DUF4760 domain-containing protein n=1 Tax=Granulicella sibirica TaxID=2479048 RepID=A0A4Q0T1L8_9BACT|nr:hypothetical protein [Granulicella sibirica]RXH57473.1 hypothetical protein GRAN_0783 [Granulicella sibirica]